MTVILDEKQIQNVLDKLVDSIAAVIPSDNLAVIGIRSRGEIIAQRLAGALSEKLKTQIPQGTLDITLYRDDLNTPEAGIQPQVRTTEIGFNIDDKVIILVDDVLYTGRSTRAALDALVDLGRPKAIKLAVLVERAGRELPIQADFSGYQADIAMDDHIQVHLLESDGKNEVIVS